jgi:hypothetical protein
MKYIKWMVFLTGVLVFPLLCVAPATAAGQVSLQQLAYGEETGHEGGGPRTNFVVTPTINASARYDSNYYLDDTDVAAYTYLLQPGVIMNYSTPKSSVDFLYTLNAYFYDADDSIPAGNYSDPSDDEYVGHTVGLSARTQATAKLALGLDEKYNLTRDPAEWDAFTNKVDRKEYYVNTLSPYVEYQFDERLWGKAAYRNTIVTYDEESDEDATEHRGLFDVRYQFWPTASLGLEYNVWQRDYDIGVSDYTSNEVNLVLRKNAKYLFFEGAVGYHNRDFDTGGREDEDAFTYRLAVGGQTSGQDQGIPKSYGKLSLIHNFNDSGVGDNFSETTGVDLTVGHVFLEKILGDFSAYYRLAEYPDQKAGNEDREDDLYGFSAGLGYQWNRWLTLMLKAGYEERDSNNNGYDYDNSFIIFTVGSAYSLMFR